MANQFKTSGRIVISLFCGGRGSSALIHEIMRQPHVDLNLLVNAYDDGLSTGALRDLIPGMLGPSDFRKNLSYLVQLYSVQQFALSHILEYRFPPTVTVADIESFIVFVTTRGAKPPAPLHDFFKDLSPARLDGLKKYFTAFFAYYHDRQETFNFSDCSLGNLLFCGAYLENNRSFNQATHALSQLFGSNANLVNVTNGQNRILVGVKEDGELLDKEARIVGPQSASRIDGIYLLEAPLTETDKAALSPMDLEGKKKFLQARDLAVTLSPEAKEVLAKSDIIIYGPGTQFSSLLPSYKTEGIAKAIAASPASIKAFIVNIKKDHDIQQFTATNIMDRALELLGDSENQSKLITHLLYNTGSRTLPDGVRFSEKSPVGEKTYKGAVVVEKNMAHPVQDGVHSGSQTIKTIFSLLDTPGSDGKEDLDIFVDLNKRSLAVGLLIQEFVELDWQKRFNKVRLFLNCEVSHPVALPPHLEIHTTNYENVFSNVESFRNWFTRDNTQYLAVLTGDGEYRLRDILLGCSILKGNPFGAVFGSRNQSRRQFFNSLHAAYGESKFLYFFSWIGAFLLTALFGLRYQIIFSDPLTGFRIYRKNILKHRLDDKQLQASSLTAASLTGMLLKADIEIAEFPVSYRTFKGFTNIKWRLARGLKDLRGVFS